MLFFLLSSYISLLFLSHILEEGSPFIFKRGGCSFWMVVLFFVLVSKLNKSLEAYIKGLTLYLPFCFICFWEKKRKIPSRVSHTQCVQKFPRCPHVCYCLFDILPTMITFSTLLLCKRGSTLSLDLSFFSAWHLLFIFSQFLPFLVSVGFSFWVWGIFRLCFKDFRTDVDCVCIKVFPCHFGGRTVLSSDFFIAWGSH